MPRCHRAGRIANCNTCCPIIEDDGDLRPFERRCDRPFRNLNDVHHAGLEGLNAVFRPGTLWENGPFVEGQDPTVVRITEKGAYTEGVNYSTQPGAECARGNPTWYIACEIVRSPFPDRKTPIEGVPPHTLVPHLGCETCCSCQAEPRRCCYNTTAGVLQSQRAEIEALEEKLRKALARANETAAKLTRTKQMIADARCALSSRTGLDS